MLGWTALALAGLALAAAVSIAASELSRQRIGLASEPINAGDELTPVRPAATPHKARHHPKRLRKDATGAGTSGTNPAPVAPPQPTSTAPAARAPTTGSGSEPGESGDSSGSSESGESGGDD